MLRRLILQVVGSCLIVNLFSTVAADDSFRARTFNYDYIAYVEWLDSLLRENEIPGAALVIVSREGIMHLQTWGVREVDHRAPVTTDSIFRIASMSKTFAGAAATLLVEQDLQTWETRISDLFPDLRLGNGVSYRSITLKQVASHSTGLMPHSYSNLLDDGIGYERIKNRFADIPAVCKPGRCYGYQNVVFSLIGDVVEESTGSSYGQYLEEQIFRPLGMVSASVGLDPYQYDANATVPHTKRQGQWRPVATNPAYYTTAPAAGINASVFDMTMWLRANLGAFPELLDEGVLNQLHTPVIETPYGNYFNRWESLENAYYGIGWRIFDLSGLRVVHHGGGVRGYRSEMAFSDEANIGLVLLINAESSAINEVIPTFFEHITNTL